MESKLSLLISKKVVAVAVLLVSLCAYVFLPPGISKNEEVCRDKGCASSVEGSTRFASRKYKEGAKDLCFCQLKGHVDDCSCDVNTVDHFNNKKIFPHLQSLLAKDFFRYFEYNPNKPCLFFGKAVSANEKCTSPRCGIKKCEADDLPPGLKADSTSNCSKDDDEPSSKVETRDDSVDSTLSDSAKKDIESWRSHDATNLGFCEVDGGQNCSDCVHVDLTINPERFTGYSGEAAHKIWRTIYEENCFRPPETDANKDVSGCRKPHEAKEGTKRAKASKLLKKFFVPHEELQELCLEKRAFYRAISGLHASITIHLSSRYPMENMKNGAKTGKRKNPIADVLAEPPSAPFKATNLDYELYGSNLQLFLSRFDPEKTAGQGPFWLKNIYFVYLLELRAILKAKEFLEIQQFYTGNEQEDAETRVAMKELLAIIHSFPNHFDETILFSNTTTAQHSSESNERLKVEFREHFLNVSRVMDCVSCDKCKLWGKLQVTGLGTALKILLGSSSEAAPDDRKGLHLGRNEVVALFNAFGRISTSIQQLENFRQQLREVTNNKPSGNPF